MAEQTSLGTIALRTRMTLQPARLTTAMCIPVLNSKPIRS
jgi:hypothetical protein